MKEFRVVLDENGVPVHVTFDGQPPTPINAFLFLSSVSVDPPAGHILVFGCSDKIGKLIYGFWRQTVEKNPESAWTIEQVARDIVKAADAARGSNPWPGEGGRAH